MKAISYDGTTFASLNVAAGIPGDLPGPDVSPVLIERFGATPIHAGLGRGARTIPVVFTVKPGSNVETTLMTLLAALDPDDESERVLAAQLNAGTDVYVNAAVAGYVYLAVNQVQVLFTASDPAWKKTSRRYSPGPDFTTYTNFTADGSLTVQNDGQTTALPRVWLRWFGDNRSGGSCTANFGYRYRRTVTVRNRSTRTLRRYPVYLDLGDTSAWVDLGYARASGDDIRIFHNGRELPRTLIGHNKVRVSGTTAAGSTSTVINLTGTPLGTTDYAGGTFLLKTGVWRWVGAPILSNTASTVTIDGWIGKASLSSGETWQIYATGCWTVLDEVQAGTTATLEIVYGNPAADAPPELTGTDAPAFDLAKSTNGVWRYRLAGTGKSAAASAGRGLWYVNPAGREVNALSWDVPGAWSRLNYLDNRDDRTQARASRVDTGTTYETAASSTTSKLYVRKVAGAAAPGWVKDQWVGARVVISGQTRYVTGSGTDYLDLNAALTGSAPAAAVALTLSVNVGRFDARRTWQDNAQYPEEGAYDGVMLSHPLGITWVRGAYSLTNPASIAKLVAVSRASGGEDWAKDVEATTTTTSTALELDWDAGAYPVQIGVALSANDDVVIPASYARDSGTASSATSTTLTDNTKAWLSGQWVNGYVKIVAGRQKGARRLVTASTANTLTVADWPSGLPDDTSRYILTADHKASAALVGSYLEVGLNIGSEADPVLEIGDVSAQVEVYDVGRGNGSDGWLTLYMGGGTNHTTYPHTLVRIGGAGKRLFMPNLHYLEIDAVNRTVRLYVTNGSSYTSVPWAVDFYRRDRKGVLARTSTWLPVKANDSKLWVSNPNWASSGLAVQVSLEEAFLG